jgi:hypothetical protein
MATKTPQKRQPRGKSTGGQFAEYVNPEAHVDLNVDLSVDLNVVLDEPEDDDQLIPQADSVANISAVVDAIADGCSTSASIAEAIGMAGRQGGYYPNAAKSLGLVVETNGAAPYDWRLSDAGERFVAMESSQRVDYMCDTLGDDEWVGAYLGEGEESLRDRWAADGQLSDRTINRRIVTIASWAKFYAETSRADQIKKIESAMTGTRVRAPHAAAELRKRHQRHVVPVRRCARCHVEAAPAVHECESCGTAL